MSDILVTRRVGRHKAGTILQDMEIDAYWNAHISASNAMLLMSYCEAADLLAQDSIMDEVYDIPAPIFDQDEDEVPEQAEDDGWVVNDEWDPED